MDVVAAVERVSSPGRRYQVGARVEAHSAVSIKEKRASHSLVRENVHLDRNKLRGHTIHSW